MTRFDASRVARMSLLNLRAQLDASYTLTELYILGQVLFEALDYTTEVFLTAVTALNLDSLV
jgi:hypothetical protein